MHKKTSTDAALGAGVDTGMASPTDSSIDSSGIGSTEPTDVSINHSMLDGWDGGWGHLFHDDGISAPGDWSLVFDTLVQELGDSWSASTSGTSHGLFHIATAHWGNAIAGGGEAIIDFSYSQTPDQTADFPSDVADTSSPDGVTDADTTTDPGTTDQTTQPVDTSADVQPVDTATTTTQPVDTSTDVQPVDTVTTTTQPVDTSTDVQPVDTVTTTTQPVDTSTDVQPVDAVTTTTQPVDTSTDVQPVDTVTSTTQPVDTSTDVQPVDTVTTTTQPVDTSTDVQPVDTVTTTTQPTDTATTTQTVDATTATAQPADATVVPDSHLDASYSVTASWDGGFNGAFSITNHGTTAVNGWSLVFDAPDLHISDSWGFNWSYQSDGELRADGADWGIQIAPGETRVVGFTASGSPSTSPVTIATVGEPVDSSALASTDAARAADSHFGTADYGHALDLSMQFYYAQYSGHLPDNYPISWRGDSALHDGADVGRDLTGGWYDAGDHVKFGLPMAYTATTLAWGGLDFASGYQSSGAASDLAAHLAWVNDYFLKCYDDKGTADLSDDVFYGQVGNGALDHAYWGAPEDMTMDRPAYAITAAHPGTEVTAETAASMAASSMVLRDAGQTALADTLLEKATHLFDFSMTYQGTYTDAIPDAANYYGSWSGYQDELSWAANWMYKATGDAQYLQQAQDHYTSSVYWGFGWDDVSMGNALLLAGETGDQKYFNDLNTYFSRWMNDYTRTPGTATNDGLVWLDKWGSNRYAANTAFLALDYAKLLESHGDTTHAQELHDFAADQIDYILGDNPNDFSYMVGFGDNYPLQPHHRAASGTTNVADPAPNAHVINGGMVGGPDQWGGYQDVRTDYVHNEVALDYNAALSGALAGLSQVDALM